MNHKKDMQAALQACVDVLLHDGVLTDPEHPKRIALDAAEAILASRPDAQADERGAFISALILAICELPDRTSPKDDPNAMVANADEIASCVESVCENAGLRIVRVAAPQAEAAQGVPDGWRELCRRLYVELFHCDQQMRSTRDQDGEPHWTQSAVVRDVLKDAKAALAAPSPDREQVGEGTRRVDELSMLIRQLVHALRKAAPDNDLAGRAVDYLERAGLQGSPLRVEAQDASPSRAHGKQDCPHGVDDGACGWCYDETVRGEQGAASSADHIADDRKLVDAASAPTLSNEQINLISEKWSARWSTGSAWNTKRCIDNALREACTLIAGSAPTPITPASAPTLGEQQWPSDRDAAIQACALMILGICKTEPQEVWPKRIEGRIRYMLSRLQPQAAEPKGMTGEQPSFTNPLTPYGMLVRALRIVAGTTLYDMAKALLTTPAKLSAMEFGRAPVTQELAFDVSAYFDALGVPDTLAALTVAANARALLANGE